MAWNLFCIIGFGVDLACGVLAAFIIWNTSRRFDVRLLALNTMLAFTASGLHLLSVMGK